MFGAWEAKVNAAPVDIEALHSAVPSR